MPRRSFILFMKLALATCGLLAFGLTAVFGQDQQFQGSTWLTNYPGLRYESNAPSTSAEASVTSSSAQTKQVQVGGPLGSALKTRKVLDIPKRVLGLINPLAPTAPQPQPETPRTAKISPNAWTTVVGWNPGGSAFPNPETHEPQMRLLTLSSGSKPAD